MSVFSQRVDLKDTFGAFLIGSFASAILLGVTCLQAFYCFMTYSDGPLVRMTVVALVILEMGQLAITIHVLYHYLIINYANPVALLETVWSIDILLGFVGLTVLIVHLSYALRIYYVSGKRKVIPILIVIVAFAHYSTGWILVASVFRLKFLSGITGFPEKMGKMILASAAAIDTTITSTLSYHLHKRRTGIKKTDKLINRLIKYTINNGVLTSVMDLVALSLVISRPRDFLFFSIVLILASLYSNALLATLNSRRKGIRDQDVVSGFSGAHLTPLRFMNTNPSEFVPGETSMTASRGVTHDTELQIDSQQLSQTEGHRHRQD